MKAEAYIKCSLAMHMYVVHMYKHILSLTSNPFFKMSIYIKITSGNIDLTQPWPLPSQSEGWTWQMPLKEHLRTHLGHFQPCNTYITCDHSYMSVHTKIFTNVYTHIHTQMYMSMQTYMHWYDNLHCRKTFNGKLHQQFSWWACHPELKCFIQWGWHSHTLLITILAAYLTQQIQGPLQEPIFHHPPKISHKEININK